MLVSGSVGAKLLRLQLPVLELFAKVRVADGNRQFLLCTSKYSLKLAYDDHV